MTREDPELMTSDEHQAMSLTAELSRVLRIIIGDGDTAESDMRELTGHIHGIQAAIMAQAAARAYPEDYRLLGE